MKDHGECPACLTQPGKYFLSIKDFKIFKCSECGLEYTNPVPTSSQLKKFYATYNDIRAPADVILINAINNLKLLSTYGYSKDKSMLDFGTGDGTFVDVAGDKCYGIDFKETNQPRVFKNLIDLPIQNFEFITMWGVLEHLENPIKTLLELKKILKPGGILALTTVYAEGQIPYHYKPVEHLTYWTIDSFSYIFNRVGLDILRHSPYYMSQRSEIYLDRLLARTPNEYKSAFNVVKKELTQYIEIPTNEIIIIVRKPL